MRTRDVIHYFVSIVAVGLLCGLTSCGFGHACEKKWSGTEVYGYGSDARYENWSFDVKEDGSCTATLNVTGDANYSREYSGSWVGVSDDIVKLEMKTEPRVSYLTRSYADIEREADKAQTRWKRSEVYRKANEGGTKAHITTEVITRYIRSDGAVSNSLDGLNNARLICK